MSAWIAAMVVAQGWGFDHMWGWGGWWWMGLTMVLFWGVVVAVVVLLVRTTDRGTRPESPDRRERAEEVLAERYARGEIDSDEYEERLAVLQRTGGP